MAIPELRTEQIEALRHCAEEYKEWLKTPKGQANINEHRDHENILRKNLVQKI